VRRVLALTLVFHVAVGSGPVNAQAPAPGQDPGALHGRGIELQAAGQHLEAAQSWLQALDLERRSPETVAEVSSHFCQAMQALTDALVQKKQPREVRQALDARRAQLDESAELLRVHGERGDIERCLVQWQTLSELPPLAAGPPPGEGGDPLPPLGEGGDPPLTPPSPAVPRSHRGLAAGVGVSAALMGVSSVLLAAGYTTMKSSYQDAQLAAAEAEEDGQTIAKGQDLCAAELSSLAGIDGPCAAHERGKGTAIAGIAGLGASTVATVVFAVLLARARRASLQARSSAYASPMVGGVMVGGSWRF